MSRHLHPVRCFAALAILGLLSCSFLTDLLSGRSSSAGEPVATQSHPPQIAFISSMDQPRNQSYHTDLYIMNMDGSELARLTSNSGTRQILNFAWSPDGARIVFSSNADGDYELYLLNADGSGVAQLTKNSKINDIQPAWSPDGQYVVYNSIDTTVFGSPSSLRVMGSDGTGDRLLVEKGETPSWSPDGSKIAFAVFEDGIYAIDPGGQNKTRLLGYDETAVYSHPRWSPDGKRILYAYDPLTNMGGLTGNIHPYIMGVDGSGPTMLSNESYCIPPFEWSPDGSSITYAKDYNPDFNNPRMYIMDSNGSNVRPLAENIEGEQPAIRP